jgi:CheY-like chemotaxis protein
MDGIKSNILVVDDEESIRDLISELLETKGYRIVTACDGQDALTKMESETFDLFITDMSMPNMDGMTLLKEIKKIQPLAVVIVLTGFSSIEGAVNAIHAGAFQYLSKPIKSKELFEIVEKGLEYSSELYGPLLHLDTSSFTINPSEPIILNGFTPEEMAEFLGLGKIKTYNTGDPIVLSEDKEGSIIIIESGDISAWMHNSNFEYLKKYDSWGEETIILPGSMPVNLRAESAVTVRVFERKRILDFFQFKGEKLLKRFIVNISSSISLKWRKSIQRIIMLKVVTND